MSWLRIDCAAHLLHQYAGAVLSARPKIPRNAPMQPQTQAFNSRTAESGTTLD